MKPISILAVLATFIVGLFVLASFLGPSQPVEMNSPPALKPGEKPIPIGEPGKEFYEANPFSAEKVETASVAETPELEFDFGTLALGATGKHDFVVKNVGQGELKLARGPAQCKCTLSGLAEEVVPAGGETKIHLEWKPTDAGPFSQAAVIWTNDPKNPRLSFVVHGTMFPALNVQPDSGWNLGAISNSQPVKFHGEISSAVYSEMKITKIDSSNDLFSLTYEPMSAEELAAMELKVGYHLLGEFKGFEDPKTFKEKFTIHTDIKERPEIELEVSLTRTGALSVIGPNWYSSGPRIDFGQIDPKKGKDLKFTLMVEPGAEELKFTETSSTPAFIHVSLKPEQVGKELARERYTMIVSVPPDSPKGIWTYSKPGTLSIKTNHPKVGELEIHLQMMID